MRNDIRWDPEISKEVPQAVDKNCTVQLPPEEGRPSSVTLPDALKAAGTALAQEKLTGEMRQYRFFSEQLSYSSNSRSRFTSARYRAVDCAPLKVSCTLTVVSADLDTETAVISRNSNCPVIIKTPEYETVYDENVEPIGVNRHMKPLMYEVPLTAGMLIVSYTDGIAHAGKKRLGHPADFEKIMEIVRKNEAEDVAFIAKSIMDYALELDAEKASDDMTVLVMGITDGSPSSPKIEQLEVTYPY